MVKLRQPPRTPSLLRAVEVLQIGFECSQLGFVIVGIGVDRLRVVRRRWGRGLWFRRPFLASVFSGKLRIDACVVVWSINNFQSSSGPHSGSAAMMASAHWVSAVGACCARHSRRRRVSIIRLARSVRSPVEVVGGAADVFGPGPAGRSAGRAPGYVMPSCSPGRPLRILALNRR